MAFDAFPPVAADPGLEAQMKQGLNHNFNLGSTYSTNPYVVFNTVSPNNERRAEQGRGAAGDQLWHRPGAPAD